MFFPKNFHGQTQWTGFPFRRGVTFEIGVGYAGNGINDFRMLSLVLRVGEQSIALRDKALVNVSELGGYDPGYCWARLDLLRQTKAIAALIKYVRLTKKGDGFWIEAFLRDHDVADARWTYSPELGQPSSGELLGDEVYVSPTPIAEIPEYQVPIYGSKGRPEIQVAA